MPNIPGVSGFVMPGVWNYVFPSQEKLQKSVKLACSPEEDFSEFLIWEIYVGILKERYILV